jgi:hypothetical protein
LNWFLYCDDDVMGLMSAADTTYKFQDGLCYLGATTQNTLCTLTKREHTIYNLNTTFRIMNGIDEISVYVHITFNLFLSCI